MERRSFLKYSSALAAASAVASPMGALKALGKNPDLRSVANPPMSDKPVSTLSNDLTPYSGTWTDTQIRHLLRRSMFGVPIAQMGEAQTLGSMQALVTKLL